MSKISSLETLVLCGGLGTRLKSQLPPDTPKILAHINGRPFIKYFFHYLENQGIKKIILCTGYGHSAIQEWVNKKYDGEMVIRCSLEEKPLGTGGAIKNAGKMIDSDTFFVINGDTFFNLDYTTFLNSFLKKEATGAVALCKKSDPSDYGTIKLDSENRVVLYEEKTTSSNSHNLINAGIYLFKKNVLNDIPSNIKSSLEYDIIPKIIRKNKSLIYGFQYPDDFIDIGTPKNYQIAFRILKKHN